MATDDRDAEIRRLRGRVTMLEDDLVGAWLLLNDKPTGPGGRDYAMENIDGDVEEIFLRRPDVKRYVDGLS